ncbi:MAG TPA: hypothetical protein VF777_02840 [Phycisphaerales bacterium]
MNELKQMDYLDLHKKISAGLDLSEAERIGGYLTAPGVCVREVLDLLLKAKSIERRGGLIRFPDRSFGKLIKS